MKLSFKETKEVMTEAQAVLEASRCLLCEDAPCNRGCPAGIDVKKFIRAIRFENFRRAINLIKERNILAGVCGTVCPVEALCEKECSSTKLSAPIRIGDLQRFVAERAYTAKFRSFPQFKKNGVDVAVIGAGPAGLSCAAELAVQGFEVTIFEKRDKLGGSLTYGIPSYRLSKRLVNQEIGYIKKLGVKVTVGKAIDSLNEIFDAGFKAIFIGVGLGKPLFCQIPGEELRGVIPAIEFLRELNENPQAVRVGERVIVIGGGSVAMDCACSALRVGAEHVDLVCLEGPDELPAFQEEIHQAEREGVNIHPRFMPLRIMGNNGKVKGLEAIKIDWKIPGWFVPGNAIEVEGSRLTLIGGTVIEAVGQGPEESTLLSGLKMDRGFLVVDEDMMTSREGVFAGGDIIASKASRTVVQSVAEGKKAAQAIAKYLQGAGVLPDD